MLSNHFQHSCALLVVLAACIADHPAIWIRRLQPIFNEHNLVKVKASRAQDDDINFQRSWVVRHGTDADRLGKPVSAYACIVIKKATPD